MDRNFGQAFFERRVGLNGAGDARPTGASASGGERGLAADCSTPKHEAADN